MEVVQLHKAAEKKSNHDILVGDDKKLFRFDIRSCGLDGVVVSYYCDVPIKEHLAKSGLPDFIIEGIANDNKTHREILREVHIHPKWWQKMLGITTRTLILKFIRETKKDLESLEHQRNAVEILKHLVEGEK